jgi:hypothetical protein
LEWVYGYRGKDARTNLYLLPTGEMVYFVAAVVVLFNAEEHSQRHYLGHTEDIKWWVVALFISVFDIFLYETLQPSQ